MLLKSLMPLTKKMNSMPISLQIFNNALSMSFVCFLSDALRKSSASFTSSYASLRQSFDVFPSEDIIEPLIASPKKVSMLSGCHHLN